MASPARRTNEGSSEPSEVEAPATGFPDQVPLTVKLRGRTEALIKRRGRTLSSRARGDTTDCHGPLQRLLDGAVTASAPAAPPSTIFPPQPRDVDQYYDGPQGPQIVRPSGAKEGQAASQTNGDKQCEERAPPKGKKKQRNEETKDGLNHWRILSESSVEVLRNFPCAV
jgi:hypothetical protein